MGFDVGILVGFALSICANVLLVWWARRMWQGTIYVEQGVRDLVREVSSYSEHLEQVYELPTFYGDSTLDALLVHTKGVNQYCSDFVESFSLLTEEEQIIKVEDVNEREQPPKTQAPPA